METLGQVLLLVALFVALLGGTLLLLSHLGVQRFPGDIVYERKHVTVYVPLGLMILISALMTLVLNLFWRR
jgi:multisubunit Na+/H+ antiporter MnhG subunit